MSMKKMQQQSYLHGSNAAFIEDLYSRYLQDIQESKQQPHRIWFRNIGELLLTMVRMRPLKEWENWAQINVRDSKQENRNSFALSTSNTR